MLASLITAALHREHTSLCKIVNVKRYFSVARASIYAVLRASANSAYRSTSIRPTGKMFGPE